MTYIKICLTLITLCQLYSFSTGLFVGSTVHKLYKELKPLLVKIKSAVNIYMPDKPEEPHVN